MPGRFRHAGVQQGVRKFFRRRSGSAGPRRASTAASVPVQAGDGTGQQLPPLRSQLQEAGTMVIVVCSDLDQAGRRNGFKAAV